MNTRQPVSVATTTIIDDTPKQRMITTLAIFAATIIVLGIVAIAYMDSLHLDQRAQIALAQAKIIGDATMGYKTGFFTVYWLSLSAIAVSITGLAVAGAVSISAMLGAYAWRSVRAALEPGYISERLADKGKVRRIER